MPSVTVETAGETVTIEYGSDRPTTHLGIPVGYVTKPTRVLKGNQTVTAGTTLSGVRVEGSVVVQDGGTFRNSEVVGTITGGASVLLTILDGTKAVVEDVTVIPQNPWPRTSYGVRAAGGTMRRVNVGFVGDPIGLIRGAVNVEDVWTHDQIKVVSPSQAGGYSHDDAIQIHGGAGHKILRTLLDAYYTPLFGEPGKQAMSGIMVTPITTPTISDLSIRDVRINGGAAGINLGALGTGPGGTYTLGTIATTVFNTDQGNHPYLAMIGNPALPVTLDRNKYTDGRLAVITRS